MTKIPTAIEAAKKTHEAQAQYCSVEAYTGFMNMIADEIKIATNNGWTSITPVRWGYLPDGWQNKVVTELSALGYTLCSEEDKLTVSWYDNMVVAEHDIKAEKSATPEEQLWAIFYDFVNYRSKKTVKRIVVAKSDAIKELIGEIVISASPQNIKAIPINDIKRARETWAANGYKNLDVDNTIWEKEE